MEMEKPQVDYTNTPAQFPPPGFSAYGEDEYGYWIALRLGEQRQRFRWIHRGCFMMGSPQDEAERNDDETLHWVNLTKGFWLAEPACTQGFWQEVMGENPSHFKEDEQRKNLPVESVNWNNCQTMLSELNKRVPQLNARLPTEAEWEYACRAGTTTPFSFGEELSSERANYRSSAPYNNQAKGEYRQRTVPVELFEPNPWGLYQMHGNVWEWCEDWYGDYPDTEVADPSGPEKGEHRVLRGGCWGGSGGWLRSAVRSRNAPDDAVDLLHVTGLRLALG